LESRYAFLSRRYHRFQGRRTAVHHAAQEKPPEEPQVEDAGISVEGEADTDENVDMILSASSAPHEGQGA